jgi:Transposase and inactivated derivatives, IS5 family
MSFAEMLVTQRRESSLDKIEKLVRWERLRYRLKKILDRSEEGRPAYDDLVMFRVMILQKLYDLSDPQMEEMLYDRLSFRRFCGLGLEDKIPDETTILRFRALLQGHSEKLLALVNQDLGEKGIEWAGGRIVDATLIKSKVRPPRGGTQSENDPEAGWTCKNDEYIYGYKGHVSTTKKGLICKTQITSAEVHDSQVLESLLDEETTKVYADKAYPSQARRQRLKDYGIKDGILYKKPKGAELDPYLKALNKIHSRIRGTIERTFAHLKDIFGMRMARYKGWDKNQVHLDLLAIAYNLKRSTRLLPG